MTPEILKAYSVARRFVNQPTLAGYCLEASVAMVEFLRRHRDKERECRVELIRRELEDGGHWTAEVDGVEYDPTCADWDDAPPDSQPGTLYVVEENSPHNRWPRTRVHVPAAYETVGIQRRCASQDPDETCGPLHNARRK